MKNTYITYLIVLLSCLWRPVRQDTETRQIDWCICQLFSSVSSDCWQWELSYLGQITEACVIKEIVACTDPSDSAARAKAGRKKRCGPARLSLIAGSVFCRLPGETRRWDEDFTFLLQTPPPLSSFPLSHSSAALRSHLPCPKHF